MWSPLNVRYGCEIEDITILCHNGRYCIHDDSHNAPEDQGVSHVYRNVRCIYQYSGEKGFNNTIGFGFSQKNQYLFENCIFSMIGCPEDSPNHSVFYGHAAGGKTPLQAEDGPSILLRDCQLLGGQANNRAARLQNLYRGPLHVKTRFENCQVQGGLYLTLYHEDAQQAFDVELVDSGRPAVLVDQEERNPYPVRIFE